MNSFSALIEIIISFSLCLSGFCPGSLSVTDRGAGSLPTETQEGVSRRGWLPDTRATLFHSPGLNNEDHQPKQFSFQSKEPEEPAAPTLQPQRRQSGEGKMGSVGLLLLFAAEKLCNAGGPTPATVPSLPPGLPGISPAQTP